MTPAYNPVQYDALRVYHARRGARIRLAVWLANQGATEAEIADALGITPERAKAIAQIVEWKRRVITV